jgi:fatty-acyl-CoA synthase
MPAYKYPLLIKQLLLAPSVRTPNKEIVYRDLVRFSYRTLFERINRLGSSLDKLGVKQGDTVAVVDYDSHRYLESYFAIPMLGAVLHTVNWRLPPEQMLYTMNHAEDKIVLVNSDFLPVLESFGDKLTTVEKFILLTDDNKKPATKLNIEAEYEEMLRAGSSSYDFPDFDEDTRATLFYTTGTTGDPKGVYFTHRQIVLHTFGIALLGAGQNYPRFVTPDEVYMPLTPMFHVHAWGTPYLSTMSGMKQVYPGKYDIMLLIKLIKKEGVTYTHCVPTILGMLLLGVEMEGVDLSGLKMIIGGAALPGGLANDALRAGIKFYCAYGLSETCPALTVTDLKGDMLDWDTDRKVSVLKRAGLPVPLVQMEIMDESGKKLPHDGKSIGEVVTRAPWLTEGYFKKPKESEQLWRYGWLHTGDIGYIDEGGYLYLTDRVKDVIKTGGEWISSLKLEDLISEHKAVAEAGVIGMPDEKWGERPMAVVVPKPEYKDKISPEDIREFLQKFVEDGTILKWAIPDRIEFVAQLPHTVVGKVDKKVLRKQYISK